MKKEQLEVVSAIKLYVLIACCLDDGIEISYSVHLTLFGDSRLPQQQQQHISNISSESRTLTEHSEWTLLAIN